MIERKGDVPDSDFDEAVGPVEVGTVFESGWTVRGIAAPNADCGGDIQDSESFVTTFTKPLGYDGLYAFVGVSCYLAQYEEGDHRRYDPDVTDLRVMQLQIEYMVCTDPADPGGTEVRAEYLYIDQQLDDPDSADDGDAEAKAHEIAADPVTDEEWNSIVGDLYPIT